ncbi:hypothetical protein J6590_020093 [Homalodisca vitripennis]|nr:hypothetical protein J6590_020093 [Homalodisca vitripennis]
MASIGVSSEQQIVDCSYETGNLGCQGGSVKNTMRYVKKNGLMLDNVYPYTNKQTICKYRATSKIITISDWRLLPPHDEEALKVAVAQIGPVVVSINASPHTFMLYHNGVYHDKDCTSDKVNHAMLLVGYTKESWILKNWWSEHWGVNGYMYLSRGKNLCGVANFAAYAIL